MTLEDFNKLNLDQKCELIWDWGFFISKSESHDRNRILYSLYGFFAEMSMRTSDNRIVEVKSFSKVNKEKEEEFEISKDNPFLRVAGSVTR